MLYRNDTGTDQIIMTDPPLLVGADDVVELDTVVAGFTPVDDAEQPVPAPVGPPADDAPAAVVEAPESLPAPTADPLPAPDLTDTAPEA